MSENIFYCVKPSDTPCHKQCEACKKGFPRHIPYTHVGGMRWVEASKRLPPERKKVVGRRNGEYVTFRVIEGEMTKVGDVICRSIEVLEEWFPGIEWLDEESPLPTETHVGEDGFLEWIDEEMAQSRRMGDVAETAGALLYEQAREDVLIQIKEKFLSLRPQPKESPSRIPDGWKDNWSEIENDMREAYLPVEDIESLLKYWKTIYAISPQPKAPAEARRNIPEDMDDWCDAHQVYYKNECLECTDINHPAPEERQRMINLLIWIAENNIELTEDVWSIDSEEIQPVIAETHIVEQFLKSVREGEVNVPDTNVGDISQQAGNQRSAEKDNPIASFCKGYETAHKQNRDQISSLTSERDDARKNSDEWQAQYRVMAEVCKTRQEENANLERNIAKLTDEALEISIERDAYRNLVEWMAKAYQTGQLATSALEVMLEEVLKKYPSNQ